MRHRKASDTAVNKTLNFLLALQHKCEGTDFTDFTTTQLHIAFKVSKSTYSVCKKLEIVRETKDGIEFLKENPNREMALSVLGVLLEQAKKEVVTPISANWTALNETLRDISEKISMGLNRNNPTLSAVKTPPKEARLFDVQEKREEQRFDLLKAIAGGVYEFATPFVMNESDTATIDSTNEFILKVTDNLFTKYYAK